MVCKLTYLGGLEITNMDKFGRAARLRWSWLAWNALERPWVGMDNSCNKQYMELFYSLNKVTIGDGNKASF
jgi:hypothetical protein